MINEDLQGIGVSVNPRLEMHVSVSPLRKVPTFPNITELSIGSIAHEEIMDSTSIFHTNPTNLLTFLVRQPDSSSFGDGSEEDPAWFSPSLPLLVSVKSPETRCLTFERVKYLVKSLASGLRKAGFLPGDRLILISSENIHMPVVLLATIAAGGFFVAPRPHYTAEQQAIILRHCEPSFILTCKEFQDVALHAGCLANSKARFFAYDDDLSDTPNISGSAEIMASWSDLVDDKDVESFRWPTFSTTESLETTVLIAYTTG